MKDKERQIITCLAFEMDFAKIGTIKTWEEDDWKNADFKDAKYHVPFGVLVPQLDIEGKWTINICPEIICRAVEKASDHEFHMWLLYLINHLQMHLVIVDVEIELANNEDDIADEDDVERKVEEALKDTHPDVFAFGEKIKYHVENGPGNTIR